MRTPCAILCTFGLKVSHATFVDSCATLMMKGQNAKSQPRGRTSGEAPKRQCRPSQQERDTARLASPSIKAHDVIKPDFEAKRLAQPGFGLRIKHHDTARLEGNVYCTPLACTVVTAFLADDPFARKGIKMQIADPAQCL